MLNCCFFNMNSKIVIRLNIDRCRIVRLICRADLSIVGIRLNRCVLCVILLNSVLSAKYYRYGFKNLQSKGASPSPPPMFTVDLITTCSDEMGTYLNTCNRTEQLNRGCLREDFHRLARHPRWSYSCLTGHG